MELSLPLFVVILAIFFVGNGVLIFFLARRRPSSEETNGLVLLQHSVQELSRTVHERLKESERTLDAKLAESSRQMQESSRHIHDTVRHQLTESQRTIKEITEAVTKLDETNKQVVSFADQLQHLEDVLKNPKQRGILGEYFLETVLKNTLPPDSYQMQYRFLDGEVVDAVVFVKEYIVPVDSKFSLENYNRIVEEKNEIERARLEKMFENDLKLRVKETAKYIRPNERTTDFAFMFIPHEAIYYDLLVKKIGEENILERAARDYKVLITSPTSFLAYLQTVLQGLRALQIEEQTKTIVKRVEELGRHLGAYDIHMQKLGNALSTSVNAYNTAHKELGKIDKDVLKITGAPTGVSVLSLDKPAKGDDGE